MSPTVTCDCRGAVERPWENGTRHSTVSKFFPRYQRSLYHYSEQVSDCCKSVLSPTPSSHSDWVKWRKNMRFSQVTLSRFCKVKCPTSLKTYFYLSITKGCYIWQWESSKYLSYFRGRTIIFCGEKKMVTQKREQNDGDF